MIAFLLLVSCVQAPTLDAEAGFQGTCFPDSWTRLSAVVNYQGEPIDAELRITIQTAAREPILYRRPLPLAAKVRMRVGSDFFLCGLETEATFELVAKGKALRTAVHQFRFNRGAEHRMLGVGPLPGFYQEGLGPKSPVTGVTTTPELFPSSPLALRCLDTIIIPEPVDFSPGQEDALRDWVRQGGRLIFGAGRSTHVRQHPFWRGMCPLGSPEIGAVSVRAGDGDFSATLVRGTLLRGEAALSLGGQPAAIRAREGAGQVVFLAFMADQAGIGRAIGAKSLMATLLELPPPPKEEIAVKRVLVPTPQRRLQVMETDDLLSRLLPRDLPLRSATLLIGVALGVVYVVLIGPVEYLRLRRKGRLRSGWASFGILVTVFTALILGWSVAFSFRQSKQVNVLLWEEGQVQTFAALRPARGMILDAEVSAGGLTPTAPDRVLGVTDPPPSITVDLPHQVHCATPPVALRTLIASRPLEEKEPIFTAVWKDAEKRAVEIRNGQPFALTRVRLVSKDAAWAVEDLPAGALREIKLDGGEAFVPWARGLRRELRDYEWWRTPSTWDRIETSDVGLVLSLYEALHDAWNEGQDKDRHIVLERRVDWSPYLARGDFLLFAAFDRDLSGIRIDPSISPVTHGWARVRVQEAKR